MVSKSYNCKKCNYTTEKKFNFNKHCKTKKHIENYNYPKTDRNYPKIDRNYPKIDSSNISDIYFCEYCNKKFTFDNNKIRHYKTCKIKKQIKENSKDKIIEELQKKLEEKDGQLEKMLDFMKTLVNNDNPITNNNITNNTNNTNNKINNNNYNMYYIINNYKDADNIEDVLESPLTQEELDYIDKNGSILGSYIQYKYCI
jgi:predicted transcriptional regulator